MDEFMDLMDTKIEKKTFDPLAMGKS